MLLTRRQFAGGLAATGALASLPGCIATNRATGRTSFTGLYSVSDDIALGRKEYPKLIESFGGRYDDPRLSAYVTRIGENLAQAAEYQDFDYNFTILNTPIVNAFALPGGYVSVSRGLLALASDEAEMAGVLAHELGHVNARHTAERLSQGMLAQLGLTVLGATVGSKLANAVGEFAAGAFIQSYSRQQEFEADTLAVRYMSRAGYDPNAMVTFLDTLRDHSMLDARMRGLPEGRVDQFNIMSTHPRTKDRVEAAIRNAGQIRLDNPIRARQAYLERINGMIYGDDPKQGMIIGRRFVHPSLRFEFNVPPGFRLHNGANEVTARHPSGAHLVFTMGRAQWSTGPAAYLSQEWGRKLSLQNIERLTVNDLPAATGTTRLTSRRSAVDLRLLVVMGDGNQVFRMAFVTPSGETADFDQDLRRTGYSFRRLKADEAAGVKPMRLITASPRSTDSIEALAKMMPHGEAYNSAVFRLLNDLGPDAPLPASGTLKIIAH